MTKDHVCGVGELDYTNVEDGYILCDVCGRIYKLTPSGWTANPRVSVPAARQQKWQGYRRRRG